MNPTTQNITLREQKFAHTSEGLMVASVYGGVTYLRTLDGASSETRHLTLDMDFAMPYQEEDYPYATGLVRVGDGYTGSPDYHLISTEPQQIMKFLKGNGVVRGFTVQFAINTSRGVVVEVFKKGHLTLKVIKMLLDMGFDQWLYSGCWAPKWFLQSNEIVPLAATFDLTTGADVNPWLKVLYGREIPAATGFSLKIHSQPHMERMK